LHARLDGGVQVLILVVEMVAGEIDRLAHAAKSRARLGLVAGVHPADRHEDIAQHRADGLVDAGIEVLPPHSGLEFDAGRVVIIALLHGFSLNFVCVG
jgi:hypothetical protein